jgi:hypothetical protein
MFLIVLMLASILGGIGVLIWIGCRRVAGHLRGKPEATRMVVEHVLMPLLGRVETTCTIDNGREGELNHDT